MYEEYIQNKTVVSIRFYPVNANRNGRKFVDEIKKAVILESDGEGIVAVALNDQFTQTKHSPLVPIHESDIVSVITYYPPTKNNRKPIVAKLLNKDAYTKAKSNAVSYYIMGVMETANLIEVAKNKKVRDCIESKVKFELSLHYKNLIKADKCLIKAKAKFHGIEFTED